MRAQFVMIWRGKRPLDRQLGQFFVGLAQARRCGELLLLGSSWRVVMICALSLATPSGLDLHRPRPTNW